MSKVITIKTAEYAVGKNDTIIETSSVGSCIVVCIFDEDSKIGGMAHSMLPHRPLIGDKNDGKKKAKYVDEAISLIIDDIEKIGANKKALKAKIIGGSEMFKNLSNNRHSVGQENINSTRKILNDLKIPIISEDTGGTVGRAASFNIENCVLNVSVRM